MSMHFDAKVGRNAGSFDHAGEAGRRQRSTALGHEHKGRLNAFPLVPAQLPQLATCQGMGCRSTKVCRPGIGGALVRSMAIASSFPRRNSNAICIAKGFLGRFRAR